MALSPDFDWDLLKGIDFDAISQPKIDWDVIKGIDWDEIEAAKQAKIVAEDDETQDSLTPEDILRYKQREDNAYTDYGEGGRSETALALQRSRFYNDMGVTAEGDVIGGPGTSFGNWKDQFKKQRDTLSQPMAQRGLFNSGVMKNAVNEHFMTKNTAYNDLMKRFNRGAADMDLTQANIGITLQRTLDEVENDREARRSVYASMINENQSSGAPGYGSEV